MKKSLVAVKVRNADINKALKIFKRMVNESGHIQELKERREYTKPTTKRRLIKQKAIRNNERMVRIEKENNKY